MTFDPASYKNDPPAAPALAALAAGKWRKARDQAKELCRKDRPRYLPLVIEANIGLYRAMLANGQTAEAGTVLAHLQTIASSDVCERLAREMEQPAPPSEREKPEPEDPWTAILPLSTCLETARPAPASAWLSVDEAVIANRPPPPGAPETPRLEEELAAVQAARDATGDGRWDDAREALKRIPSTSVFQHWRLFLRGVRHWFCGETAQAERCFRSLPAEGACARAAAAIAGTRPAAGKGSLPTGAHLAAWRLAVTGEDTRKARAIAEADAAWRSGSWKRAFDLLRPAPESPEKPPGLESLWLDMLFPASPPDSPAAERRLRETVRFLEKLSAGSKMSRHLFQAGHRASMICDAEAIPAPELWSEWRFLLDGLDRLLGKSAIRNSVGHQWLGEQLGRPSSDFPPFDSPRIKDAARATQAFENAMKLDPGNEAAALNLLGLLGLTGKSSERNRLLDDLVQRFPDNKKILTRAGSLAVDRKALGKGAEYFRRACALDPLDSEARAGLVTAHVLRARDLAKKGRDTAPVWAEIEPLLSDRPAHSPLMLSRWSQRLRRSLLDGNAETAASAFREAEALASDAAERLLLERLLAALYKTKLRENWSADWKTAPVSTWETLERLLEVIRFAAQVKEWNYTLSREAESLLLAALRALLRDGKLEEAPEAALRFVQSVRAMRRGGRELDAGAPLLIDDAFQLLHKRARRSAKRPDLHLRLLSLECQAEAHIMGPTNDDRQQAERLIADAEKAGARDVVQRARQLLTETGPPDFGDLADPEFDDDDEDEEGDDGFTAAQDFFMDIAAAILDGDEAALAKLRSQATAAGMPDAEFQAMVDRFPAPKRRKRGKSPAPSPSPGGDRAQSTFDF